jgi:hypothetical protein
MTNCKWCGVSIREEEGNWWVVKEEDRYESWAFTLCQPRKSDVNKRWHQPEDRLVTLAKQYLKNHPEENK